MKGIKAISFGGSYEAKLVESLDAIKEKSKALMGEATKSHIHEFHACKQAKSQRVGVIIIDGWSCATSRCES